MPETLATIQERPHDAAAGVPALAISASGLGKCYQIYDNPNHRLRAALMPWKKCHPFEFWALRDVSFEVRRGEALGILGRNGSGKSTLLQLIAGILRPSAGRIARDGRISALLELGSGFNPEFTGRENVFLNGSVLGISTRRMRDIYDEITAFADIGGFIDQPVKSYSSGMMIRLAFAVAVAVEPDILIVDEALAVGDIAFQRKCFRRVEELRARGMTLLWVTHDPGLVRQICNRAIVLEKGRMIGSGEAGEMADLYLQVMFGGYQASIKKPEDLCGTGVSPETGNHGRDARATNVFEAVPDAMRYEAAEHLAARYEAADTGAHNVMEPFRMGPGRYHLELRMACQAEQPKAVEVMIADWANGGVAFGCNPPVAGDSMSTQTLEYDFELADELAAAEVRVTNLGGASIQLAALRLWLGDPADPSALRPIVSAAPACMQYFNGRETVPFATVPAVSGALARILASDEAVLERAALLDGAGKPRAFFLVDDEITIVSEVRVTQPIESFQYGILIRDKLGTDIFGESRSNAQLGLLANVQPGTLLRFRTRIRASLRQSTYFISIGLTDHSFTKSYYYGMDLLQFPLRERMAKVFGIANLPHEFEAECLAADEEGDGK